MTIDYTLLLAIYSNITQLHTNNLLVDSPQIEYITLLADNISVIQITAYVHFFVVLPLFINDLNASSTPSLLCVCVCVAAHWLSHQNVKAFAISVQWTLVDSEAGH